MVTAEQARGLGVSRVDISRLLGDGSLERVDAAARVYRLTGSPPEPELDGLRAAWLQLGEGVPASMRVRRPDAVVSHRSAAAALGLGDLLADVHEFYVLHRNSRDVLISGSGSGRAFLRGTGVSCTGHLCAPHGASWGICWRSARTSRRLRASVSYTHLTLPTTPYV